MERRHLRTDISGPGDLDGSRPCDVAKLRPLGSARFGLESAYEGGIEYREERENSEPTNRGSHDEDPCETFNEQLNHNRLSRS